MDHRELFVVYLRHSASRSAAGGVAFAGGVDMALAGGVGVPVANHHAAHLPGGYKVGTYPMVALAVLGDDPLIANQIA
ncbi:MAG: hypothetical protein LBH91_01595 [Prevotellaceae bacterium]|nr:hypothetical protein [Prevotellaceae bacterium]